LAFALDDRGISTSLAVSSVAAPRQGTLPQIAALTGLRFFAAFFILFAHAVDWLFQFQNSNARASLRFVAMYGMPLFFVLSGFVIHYNYRRLFITRSIGRATCEFAAARFARLVPLYLFFLLIAIAADDFVSKVQGYGDLWAKIMLYYATLTQSWWYIIYNDRSIIHWLFSLSWSISTEMFFYAAFVGVVFFILAIRTARQSVIAALAYALIVMTALVVSRYYLSEILAFAQPRIPDYIGMDRPEQSLYRWLFYFSPYARVFEFFMGCLAAHAFILHLDRPVTRTEHQIANAMLVAALATLGLFGALNLGVVRLGGLNAYVQHLSLNFLCAPAIGYILFYVGRYDSGFTRFMASPTLVALGETSYSIYLVHTWTLRIFSRPPRPDADWLWGSEGAFRVICAIVLTLLVSYATYRLIEVPSRSWLRRKLGRLIAARFDRDTSRIPERGTSLEVAHSAQGTRP